QPGGRGATTIIKLPCGSKGHLNLHHQLNAEASGIAQSSGAPDTRTASLGVWIPSLSVKLAASYDPADRVSHKWTAPVRPKVVSTDTYDRVQLLATVAGAFGVVTFKWTPNVTPGSPGTASVAPAGGDATVPAHVVVEVTDQLGQMARATLDVQFQIY